MLNLFFFLPALITFLGLQSCNAHIFSFEMHHRFSDPLKNWSESGRRYFSAENWPEKGSIEYYAQLADRDRNLRERRLSDSDDPLTFSEGNSTNQVDSWGFLHYTIVSIGTPAVKFMVALDTGSDLFWVPCDGAVTNATAPFDSEFELKKYSPNVSSTSQELSCNHMLCPSRNFCPGAFARCPYERSYVSINTSTFGILVQDLLHLKTKGSGQEIVDAYITFGCGQVQTGSFLDTAAPNGLFGLGMERISVPSILSRGGYIYDSFSMCFGRDGTGRINFGDQGSLDQEETPFNLNDLRPSYNVFVTQVRVGTTLIDSDFTVLYDSGTTFSYLSEPAYTMLTDSFHSQVQDVRLPIDTRLPFQYCYDMGSYENSSLVPSISFTMKGGGQFAIDDPIVIISYPHQTVYCLGIVHGPNLNIIGQNFMTGYRIVFDRERLVLGWKKFDCYDTEESITSELESRNASNVPLALAAGLNTSPPACSFSSHFYTDKIDFVFLSLTFNFLFVVLVNTYTCIVSL